MAFIFGTSTNYQTFASILRRCAIGTSLQSITSVAGGGTGYTVGDILTVSGGTNVIAATLEVLTVSSGVVTAVRVRNAGLYTTTPSNAASVTGGTGTGATFNLTWGTNGWTSRRANGCPEAAASATVAAGGTGYTLNDTLTVSGGTRSSAATFRVSAVSSGVVTAVTLLTTGDYTTTPGNPASTTGGTGTGCTLNITYGTGEREVILEGSGSGSDAIIVGYRSFFDSGSGARNLVINGFTGFDAALTYDNQPGRSPGLDTAASGSDLGGAYLLLTNATVTWWISVTSRRIIAVAKTGTCYSSCYMGFLNPFATSGEWPYPIFVCGTTSDRFRIPSSTVISTSSIVDPVKQTNAQAGPGFVRSPAGTWESVFNSTNGAPRFNNTTGVVITPAGLLSGVTPQSGDGWFAPSGVGNFTNFIPVSGDPGSQTIRLIPSEEGSNDPYIRIPATVIWSSGTTPGGVYGELDGCFWFEAAGVVVPENRLTNATERFTVFQSGVRSDNWALWCLKES